MNILYAVLLCLIRDVSLVEQVVVPELRRLFGGNCRKLAGPSAANLWFWNTSRTQVCVCALWMCAICAGGGWLHGCRWRQIPVQERDVVLCCRYHTTLQVQGLARFYTVAGSYARSY
jgi:hypothetical protein